MATDKLRVSYVRVSSVGQNVERQTEGFAASQKFDRTYTDKISGAVPFAQRPAGARLLEDCQQGMIGEVHFWELSRMGRDTLDILTTVRTFEEAGIQVVIAKEGIRLLDEKGKVSATAAIIISVISALAGIERQNIRERQLEGIAVAKAQGRYLGRRHGSTESTEKFLAKPRSQQIAKLLDEGYRVVHIAKLLDCSAATVIKVKRLRNQGRPLAA